MVLPVDPARYGAFLAIMSVMAVTPGPANIFAIATGMQRGKAQALIGVAGMNAATLGWFGGAGPGPGGPGSGLPPALPGPPRFEATRPDVTSPPYVEADEI